MYACMSMISILPLKNYLGLIMLLRRGQHYHYHRISRLYSSGGESLLIRAAQFPHLGCGNWAPKNFRSLVRRIIKKWISRKLGKNVNLFHPNMNFFKSQPEKVSRFLMSGMWKLSLDVENNFHIPDIKERDTFSVWP